MSPLKEIAIKAIETLPDDADLDRIINEIIYRAKIAEGLRDIKEGRVVDIDVIKADFGLIYQ